MFMRTSPDVIFNAISRNIVAATAPSDHKSDRRASVVRDMFVYASTHAISMLRGHDHNTTIKPEQNISER